MKLIVLRKSAEKGNSIVEFAVTFPVVLAFFMCVFILGIGMVKGIQTGQVNRNAGILFMKGIDMSVSGNQQLVVRTASGLNMTTTGGNGLIILTQILYVGNTECTAGGLTPPGGCANWDQFVIIKRNYIGNQSLTNGGTSLTSQIGTPNPTILDSYGVVMSDASNVPYYLTDGSTLSTFNMVHCGSTTICAGGLQWGALAYVSESWFTMPELTFPSLTCFFPWQAGYGTCSQVSRALYSIYVT